MKVRLNLATTPLESTRGFAAGATIVGGLGILALLFLGWHAYSVWHANTQLRIQQARIESDTARLRAQRAELEAFFNRPETVQRQARAAFLNSLIAQRAFPWIKIFMALERSLPAGVRVISIEPHLVADHLELKFVIGAASDESKLKFLRALEDSSQFSGIEVLGETRSNRPGDADAVTLALQAQYSTT